MAAGVGEGKNIDNVIRGYKVLASNLSFERSICSHMLFPFACNSFHFVLDTGKAALHNPNVSEEAKKHAEQELNRLEGQKYPTQEQHVELPDMSGKNVDNVLRAYKVRILRSDNWLILKAASHNPNNSEEAREHARLVVQELEEYQRQPHYQPHIYPEPNLVGKDLDHVIRGYKVLLFLPGNDTLGSFSQSARFPRSSTACCGDGSEA